MEKTAEKIPSWAEWKAKAEARFRDENGHLLDPPIRVMIAYNGRAKGKKKCGDCKFCVSKEHPTKAGRHILACTETDQKDRWNKDWPACGKFTTRKEEIK